VYFQRHDPPATRGRRGALAAVLLVLLAASSAGAQGTPGFGLDPAKPLAQYSRDVWQVDDGLPQNSVNAMVQTRDGYLWLGTRGGLATFDGVRFQVFDHPSFSQLHQIHILALFEDSRGNLWIGTSGGGVSRLTGGVFTTFTTADGLTSNVVWAIAEGRDGSILMGTDGGGVTRFKDNRFTPLVASGPLARGFVTALLEDRQGAIWLGTGGHGLTRYLDGKTTTFTAQDGLGENYINVLFEDHAGALWIGTYNGLVRYANGQFTRYTEKDGLSNDNVWAICEDSRQTMWFGTYGGGLNRLVNGRFSALTTKNGLSNDIVMSILEDREGSLWVGTSGGGVDRLQDGIFTTYGRDAGLGPQPVTGVAEDRSGAIWSGTDGDGLFRLADGRVTRFTKKDGLADDEVSAIAADGDGTLWVGTDGSGISRYANGRFTSLGKQDGLPSEFIDTIVPAREGGVWIGTDGRGLARYANGTVTVRDTSNGLSNDFVRAVLETKSGELWVGTYGGGVTRIVGGHASTIAQKDGLSSDFVTALYQDADGAIWVGTYGGGLTRYLNGRLTRYTTAQGLLHDVVFDILGDDGGNLWVAGMRGVFRLSRGELDDYANGLRTAVTSISYGRGDGLWSIEVNGDAVRARDGRLWFGTSKGLAVVDPRRAAISRPLLSARVDDVLGDGAALDWRRPIEPPAGRGTIEFQYTAPTFRAATRVQFRYRLQGVDAEWVDAGTRRRASYSHLGPGTYRFEVMARNEDGVWSAPGSAVSLVIAPRLYETGWFRALAALAGVTALVGLVAWSRRRAGRRQEELEWLVDRRTAQLRQEIADRERAEEERRRLETQIQHAQKLESLAVLAGGIAHDFNNLLSAILGNAELAQLYLPADSEAREAFEQIEAAAITAAELTSQMLAYSGQGRLVVGAVSLKQIVEEMTQLLRAILSHSVEVRYEHAADVPAIQGDATQLRQIVMNLMINASEAIGDEDGVITLRTGVRAVGGREVPLPDAGWLAAGEYVFLEVSDTGSGMDETTAAKIFDPFFTTKFTGRGLGLAAAQGIMRSHHGAITVDTAPGKGTTFTLLFPPCEVGADGGDDAGSAEPPRAAPVRF